MGDFQGQAVALVSRVVGNGHLGLSYATRLEVVGQALRSQAKRVFVDAVGAHAHDAAQAARAKFQIRVKRFVEGRRVLGEPIADDGLIGFGKWGRKPSLGLFKGNGIKLHRGKYRSKAPNLGLMNASELRHFHRSHSGFIAFVAQLSAAAVQRLLFVVVC